MKVRPPPHLTVRSVGGEPLALAFKVAFDRRRDEVARGRSFGRLRTTPLELTLDDVPALRKRVEALGFEPLRLYAVPYVPLGTGGRHLALVACQPDTPERGAFMMRRGGRWCSRPYLRRLLAQLDPEGVHLRIEEPS